MALTRNNSNSNKYCFDVAEFASEASFDPATFVTATKEVTSLEVLREHLRSYQRDLREELYEVINRDLADYLNLSSKLSGVEAEVLEIRAPLEELKSHVAEAQEFAAGKKQDIQTKLQERAGLKNRRAVLEKRLQFLGTLADVEIMLGMPGAGWTGGRTRDKRKVKPLRDVGEAAVEELTPHCATLERLAQAWLSLSSDLQCFPTTEEEDDVPTSSAMGLRLLRVEKALLQHLSAVLRTVICPKNLVISLSSTTTTTSNAAAVPAGAAAAASSSSSSPPPPSSSPKNKQQQEEEAQRGQVNLDALRHCLRAFVVLGRGDEAEKQTARLLMLPFIDLNFTQGRLDGGSRGSCSGLATIYAACLRHVQQNLTQVLLIGEECAGSGSGSGIGADAAAAATSNYIALDLVCNGVWRPIHQALCSRLGAIFAPGIASILHSNYVISMKFLQDLALLTGPTHQAALQRRIQAHAATKDFKGRWNLPVYFHLRFTEVSTQIDKALAVAAGGPAPVRASTPPPSSSASTSTTSTTSTSPIPTPTPPSPVGPEQGGMLVVKNKDAISSRFHHPIFVTVWHALLGLWVPEVFLPPLTPRLFKLMLQIVGRFQLWLEEAFVQMEGQQQRQEKGIVAGSNSSSSSKPFLSANAPEALINVSWDIFLFSQEVAVERLKESVVQAVMGAGSSTSKKDDDLERVIKEGLAEAMKPLDSLVQRGWQALHTHVVRQSVTVLQAVRGITATYRMTNKRPPERASPFVAKILEPLRLLEPEMKGKVPPAMQLGWKTQVLEAVLVRYLEATQELLNSVDQMEDALKKRKQRAKGGGAGGAGGGGGGSASEQQSGSISSSNSGAVASSSGSGSDTPLSDSDKIKLQLLLDVATFAEEMDKALAGSGGGSDPLKMPSYLDLLRAVSPARFFLGRSDVKATLPPRVEALLAEGM